MRYLFSDCLCGALFVTLPHPRSPTGPSCCTFSNQWDTKSGKIESGSWFRPGLNQTGAKPSFLICPSSGLLPRLHRDSRPKHHARTRHPRAPAHYYKGFPPRPDSSGDHAMPAAGMCGGVLGGAFPKSLHPLESYRVSEPWDRWPGSPRCNNSICLKWRPVKTRL